MSDSSDIDATSSTAADAPQVRDNPFGDPVIVAAARAARPHTSRRHEAAAGIDHAPEFETNCPFCPGNEAETPPEITAVRADATAPDTAGWTVRVVPNKFPALVTGPGRPDHAGSDVSAPAANAASQRHDLFACVPAYGSHEVAIHSPDHSATLARLGPERLAAAMDVWRARTRQHRSDGWAATTICVNEGREAGASLAHPHAQLFATENIPPDVSRELDRQDAWSSDRDRSLLGSVVEAERGGPRAVDTEGDLLAWVPYWASNPYEVWIAAGAPDSGSGAFADASDASMSDLAFLVGRVASRIGDAAGDPALNLFVRDLPHNDPALAEISRGSAPDAYWNVRVLPRTRVDAGFELATGMRIVTASPEACAQELRVSAAL